MRVHKPHSAKVLLCNLFRGQGSAPDWLPGVSFLLAICGGRWNRRSPPSVFDLWNLVTVKWKPEAVLYLSPCLAFLSTCGLCKNLTCHPLPPAHEVPAAAAEVPGVSRGRQSPGGSAGAARRADAPQVQHGSHPRPQRVRFELWRCVPLTAVAVDWTASCNRSLLNYRDTLFIGGWNRRVLWGKRNMKWWTMFKWLLTWGSFLPLQYQSW